MNHIILVALVMLAATAAQSAPEATFGPLFSDSPQRREDTRAQPLAGQFHLARQPNSFTRFSPPFLNNRNFESRTFGTRPRFGGGFFPRRRLFKQHRPRFRAFGHAHVG